ncbi:TetR/AcrR family transcriptional regulator [Bradyrhizobium sp. P5_C12]
MFGHEALLPQGQYLITQVCVIIVRAVVKENYTGLCTMKRAEGRTAMQERILDTADRLFYGQGIRATGVDTIADEIGISKRTLYNYFPSKDELIVAYLERRLRPRPPSEQPPAEQILGDFERLESVFADRGFRGCPFVNAVAELKEPGHAANRIALGFKEQRRIWFRDLLMRLKVTDPETLSLQLVLLVDGAIAAALVRGDPAVARAARAAARVLLAAAGVDPPDSAARHSGSGHAAALPSLKIPVQD